MIKLQNSVVDSFIESPVVKRTNLLLFYTYKNVKIELNLTKKQSLNCKVWNLTLNSIYLHGSLRVNSSTLLIITKRRLAVYDTKRKQLKRDFKRYIRYHYLDTVIIRSLNTDLRVFIVIDDSRYTILLNLTLNKMWILTRWDLKVSFPEWSCNSFFFNKDSNYRILTQEHR